MAWGIPDNLEFTPKEVLRYFDGHIVVGVDGELQKIDHDGNLVGQPKKPFPTPIKSAVIIDNMLVATWLDQELLLARMAAIDLNNEFQQGVNRGDLRVRKTVDKSIHPQGNTWSHVLDAEPLSLTANSNSFTFVLWRKGIYNLSVDAIENWRSPEPSWKKLAKIPRAMETVGTTCDEQYFESWSKGGGIIRFDIQSGKTIESKIIPIDGYLEAVFKHGEHYLLQLNNSTIAIYEAGEIKLTAKLSGPINYAEWSEDDQGWHIAGWRELAFISAKTMSRTQLSEIAVYIDSNSGIYLCNDGTWDIIDAQEEE
jgi:hypothetical protein